MAGFENHTWQSREKITLEQIQNINDGIYDSHYSNAGAHNAMYRGKSLGSSYTDDQSSVVKAATYDDLFIGDYWTISSTNYRIGCCDYYYRIGSSSLTTHHLMLVPDTRLYTAPMNATNTTEGGYIGSAMFTKEEITVDGTTYTGLQQAEETITAAFGSNILNYDLYATNAVTSGYPSGGAWTGADRICDLMNEEMLYGSPITQQMRASGGGGYTHTSFKSQLPLFLFAPQLRDIRAAVWLQNVASSTSFSYLNTSGNANTNTASTVTGVRPVFLIS